LRRRHSAGFRRRRIDKKIVIDYSNRTCGAAKSQARGEALNRDNGENRLQWTVVYNLSTIEGIIFANRNIANLVGFQISP